METNICKLQKIRSILYYTFIFLPIIAGFDTFADLLTNWDKYLAPWIIAISPVNVSTFMMVVGVIEIAVGIIVFFRPAIGATIISGWLFLIALTLISSGKYLDIAMRDLVISISAYVFAKLSNMNLEK